MVSSEAVIVAPISNSINVHVIQFPEFSLSTVGMLLPFAVNTASANKYLHLHLIL